MSNDERREKRVQASLRVRYKSATVTEFIEKHCHDISPGGVFIRSQKPLARGSLLKIDFRLEDDTAVIQGVGRVVWTREDSGDGKPAGMGIKFIRLDADSEENIHKIIAMQKEGKEITRESVFGEPGDDTTGSNAVPTGVALSDSMAPSVENVPTDEGVASPSADETPTDGADAEVAASAAETTASATDSVADDNGEEDADPGDGGNGGDGEDNGEDGSGDDGEDTRPDKPSIPPATVFPAEEEKGSNWGIVLVVVLIVAGALAFILTRSGKKDQGTEDTTTPDQTSADTATGESSSGDSAVAADTTDSAEPDDTGDTATADSDSTTNSATAGTDSDTLADSDTVPPTDSDTAVDTGADASLAADTQAIALATGAASGEVTITLNEPEATVYIDGVLKPDGAPITLSSLPAGEHRIKAEMFGYRPLEEKFVAVAGEPLELAFKMKRAHIVTTLKANVLGAEVYVGKDRIGLTPKRIKKRFDPSFEYRFTKPGFEDFNGLVKPEDWVYEAGVYRITLDVTLVPQNASPADESATATAQGASAAN